MRKLRLTIYHFSRDEPPRAADRLRLPLVGPHMNVELLTAQVGGEREERGPFVDRHHRRTAFRLRFPGAGDEGGERVELMRQSVRHPRARDPRRLGEVAPP